MCGRKLPANRSRAYRRNDPYRASKSAILRSGRRTSGWREKYPYRATTLSATTKCWCWNSTQSSRCRSGRSSPKTGVYLRSTRQDKTRQDKTQNDTPHQNQTRHYYNYRYKTLLLTLHLTPIRWKTCFLRSGIRSNHCAATSPGSFRSRWAGIRLLAFIHRIRPVVQFFPAG